MENEAVRKTTLERKTVDLTIPEASFQFNEAINTLRGNIQLSGYNIKIICITSTLSHEGKSSVSFRLAKSFAALGKRTLFLDCDIRNSKIPVYLDVKKVSGLSEHLCGNITLDDAIYSTNDSCLDIVFTGATAPNPSELFSGDLFSQMLETLRSRYDYVIVDTPPVNPVIDGVLIAKQCDGAVLIVESGTTGRKLCIRTKQQLDYAGVKLLGVVLNKVGGKKSRYGYGYGYGYGHKYGYGDYGYGQDQEKDKKSKARKK